MSFVPAKPATDNDENERNATPHTAVLLRTFRQKTGLRSGVILAEQALRTANLGITCRAHMRLGAELPFYEVASVHPSVPAFRVFVESHARSRPPLRDVLTHQSIKDEQLFDLRAYVD